MENILDFEYVLREVEQDQSADRIAECESARRTFGSERDGLFQQEEEVVNFREYGAPFEGASPPEPPEWSQFISDCQSHLANKSKDLWVCVWLTEVLLAQWGFRGLAEGFQLIRETTERYWDQLEPSPTGEDGIEYTLKLLSAISRRDAFLDAIRFAPITMESGQYLPASCATIDELDGGEVAALVGDTSDEFISQIYESVKSAIQEWESLDVLLEEKCGDDKPPTVKVRETLTGCLNQILTTYPQLAIEEEDESESAIVVAGGNGAQAGLGNASLSGDSHLRNREQAFKTLEMLSRYFAENEPNSPISSLLRQAARYGRLSFTDLMRELAEDEDARDRILRLAGAGGGSGDNGNGYQDDDD